MTTQTAIQLATAEAIACRCIVSVVETVDAHGRRHAFPARRSWLDSLAEDNPLWLSTPYLVGDAHPDGGFSTEW